MDRKKVRSLLGWTIPFLCGAGILILMNTVLFLGYVPTASMEPTISAGSYVLGYRLHGPLEKGDIIIFEHDGKVLVKRIFAVPGSVVKQLDSTLLVVPDSCYYVLGDNADQSVDSRYWEEPFVEEKDVIALVWLF